MSKYRVRQLGGFHITPSSPIQVSCGGVSPPAFSSYSIAWGSGQPLGTFKIIEDYVTKDYKKLIARGTVINSPMSSVELSLVSPSITNEVREKVGTWRSAPDPAGWQWSVYGLSGDLMSDAFGPLCNGLHSDLMSKFPLDTSLTALENRALIEALNRIEPAKSQSLVTALEAHKTFDMLIDRVRKIADVIQLVKGRKRARLEFMFPGKRRPLPKKVVVWDPNGTPLIGKNGKPTYRYLHPEIVSRPPVMDDAAKLWLEYRYGWAPLVYDIVDSLKAMYAADLRGELIQHERFTARGKASYTSTVSSSVISGINYFGNHSCSCEATHRVDLRAYFLYKVDSPDGFVRRLNDFGLFDLPAALWEITPWSFVADWIIPIGDWISALQPKIGVTVLASGLTTAYQLDVVRRCTGFTSGAVGNAEIVPAPCPIGSADKASLKTKGRDVTRSLPTFPPMTVKLSSKRLVDAVSLLKGARLRTIT